jgi:transcriptional regulator with XRE-family HTH domain
MDWQPVSTDLMRALRGRRSQRALSRRLGFSSNVVYRWESGRAAPAAHEFFRLAALGARAPFRRLVDAGFRFEEGRRGADLTDAKSVAEWVDAMRGELPIKSLAESTGFSRFVISRWLSGRTLVRLADLLKLVEAVTRRGLDFVAVFADPAKLASTADEWAALSASREAALRHPWSHAVLRVLELEQYAQLSRHERGFIAGILGIPLREEEACLDVLRRSGQIRLEGRRWVVGTQRTVDTRSARVEGHDPRGFWLEVAHDNWRKKTPGIYGYNLCSLSEADFQRLQQLHRRFFAEMREIVAQSSPNQRVALVTTQLIGF